MLCGQGRARRLKRESVAGGHLGRTGWDRWASFRSAMVRGGPRAEERNPPVNSLPSSLYFRLSPFCESFVSDIASG